MDFRKPAALHDAFALQAKKQFRALLARTGGSTAFASSSSSSYPGGPSSGPRSWSNGNHLSQHMSSSSSKEDRIDINARDGLGRTILHIVAYSLEPHALDYLRLILDTHPKSGININLQDVESGWTALHRALWVGNLAAARMLLAEDKIDASVKDFEGLTCWDLYNSTVEGVSLSLCPVWSSAELADRRGGAGGTGREERLSSPLIPPPPPCRPTLPKMPQLET